jgi:hypothetical protein
LLLAAAIPATATIVRALSIEQLTATADVIAEGRVTAQSSSWNDEKTRIYTVTTLAVLTAHKGPVKPGETLQIRQIGGTVDGLTQSIVGNAKLSVGEEMLVFLDRDEDRGLHYVVGMAQGKFSIDRASPTPRLDRPLQNLSTLDAKGSPVPLVTPGAAPTVQALDGLRARIRDAINR